MGRITMRRFSYDGSPTDALAPDYVLPAQLLAPVKLTPEQRLCLAVLEEAFGTFRRYRAATEPKARQLAKEAAAWIASDDDTWPFAYRRVCDAVGFDPDWLRDGIEAWQDRTTPEDGDRRRDQARARRMQAAVFALRRAGWTINRIGPAIGYGITAADHWLRGSCGVSEDDVRRLEALVAQSTAA